MTNYLAPFIVPLLIAALMVRRSAKARKIRIARMWVTPALFGVLVVLSLVVEPALPVYALAAFAAAAALGAATGYFRALHTFLTVDPATGNLTARPTVVGTILLLALFVVRFGLRQTIPQAEGLHGHMSETVLIATNTIIIFTVAMLFAQAYFVRARARPLLEAHRAATAGGSGAQ